jgi:predicted AAA+ superfamily ATPase
MSGKNCSIFVIGPKQTGKTYTLIGDDWEQSIKNQALFHYNPNRYSINFLIS